MALVKTVGNNIRHYRKEKNMRQEDLARKIGVSENYIGMIERSEKTPSLETFISIMNALDVSADMLLLDQMAKKNMVLEQQLSERMQNISDSQRETLYDIINAYLKHVG